MLPAAACASKSCPIPAPRWLARQRACRRRITCPQSSRAAAAARLCALCAPRRAHRRMAGLLLLACGFGRPASAAGEGSGAVVGSPALLPRQASGAPAAVPVAAHSSRHTPSCSPCGGLGVTGARLALAVRLRVLLLLLGAERSGSAASLAAPARLLAPRTSFPASQAAVANATHTSGDSSGTRVMAVCESEPAGRQPWEGWRRRSTPAAAAWRRLGTRRHAHPADMLVGQRPRRTWKPAPPLEHRHTRLTPSTLRGRAPGPSACSAELPGAAFAPNLAEAWACHAQRGGSGSRRWVLPGRSASTGSISAQSSNAAREAAALNAVRTSSCGRAQLGPQPLASPWLATGRWPTVKECATLGGRVGGL